MKSTTIKLTWRILHVIAFPICEHIANVLLINLHKKFDVNPGAQPLVSLVNAY